MFLLMDIKDLKWVFISSWSVFFPNVTPFREPLLDEKKNTSKRTKRKSDRWKVTHAKKYISFYEINFSVSPRLEINVEKFMPETARYG